MRAIARTDNMAKTVADLLIERLVDWGVQTIFGFPGDGVNGIFEALRTHEKDIQFIQVRHEEAAALAYRTVAHITIPKDIQDWTSSKGERSPANIPKHSSDFYPIAYPLPPQKLLEEAAELINAGSKVAIMAGRGCLNARDEVLELAKTVAGPVIKPLLGKAVGPDRHSYTTGGIGLLGTAPSQDALPGCETLILARSRV